MTTGYSGTPLPRKLGIKTGHVVGTFEAVLRDAFGDWKARIRKDGGLWIAWPKKSSPLATELRESHVRATGLESGLVDNKICAIDADWSGLRFVYRREER